LLREESGFTLTEILVTSIMMVMVLSAIYSVSDMTLRVFSVGNDKVEAVESARVGMEKMEREIRAAYPVDSLDSDYLFFNANGAASDPPQLMPTQNGSQITFGNNLGAPVGDPGGADEVIICGDPCEYITYKLTEGTSEDTSNTTCTVASLPPCTLRRVNTASSAALGDPVVESVAPGGLTFEYLNSDGSPVTTGDEDDIRMVRITLVVRVDRHIGDDTVEQTLTTDVDLRNR
jgi:type II secretory pathway component PulJ